MTRFIRSCLIAMIAALVSAPLLGVAGISVVTHGRAKSNMMRRGVPGFAGRSR